MHGTRRYHFNVSAERLSSHVEKGHSEGLRITSVASCKGLWAVIMNASAKQMDQVRAPPRTGCSLMRCHERRKSWTSKSDICGPTASLTQMAHPCLT